MVPLMHNFIVLEVLLLNAIVMSRGRSGARLHCGSGRPTTNFYLMVKMKADHCVWHHDCQNINAMFR